ncbi:hypothetical protein GE21DRAFT_1344589 [Neurospora crassa]|nr:hypothetical protein GE21DRAFT_1344589 [Neurospora crassa]
MASSKPPLRPETVLVTGSSGHLGRALMLSLPSYGYAPIGLDIKPSSTTTFIGSFGDASLLQNLFSPSWLRAPPEISSSNHHPNLEPTSHIIHCATLHKPHIESHTKAQFVQTNIADTLTLLEAAAAAATTTTTATSDPDPDANTNSERTGTIKSFTYISTTPTFGPGVQPKPAAATHITEQAPLAEDIRNMLGEEDDGNLKLCELAYRRVDIADIVSACVASIKAQQTTTRGTKRIKFGKYRISGPSPFLDLPREDWVRLNTLSPADGAAGAEKVFAEVAERLCPGIGAVMEQKGWKWLGRVDRVYDSRLAMEETENGGLGWKPEWTFQRALERIVRGEEWRSGLTGEVGKLGYHDRVWGVYTTE